MKEKLKNFLNTKRKEKITIMSILVVFVFIGGISTLVPKITANDSEDKSVVSNDTKELKSKNEIDKTEKNNNVNKNDDKAEKKEVTKENDKLRKTKTVSNDTNSTSTNNNGTKKISNKNNSSTSKKSKGGSSSKGDTSKKDKDTSGGSKGGSSDKGDSTPSPKPKPDPAPKPDPKPDPAPKPRPDKPIIPANKSCKHVITTKQQAIAKAEAVTGSKTDYNYGISEIHHDVCVSDYSWNGNKWTPVYAYTNDLWEITMENGQVVLVCCNGSYEIE